jgi:hypothetical protein
MQASSRQAEAPRDDGIGDPDNAAARPHADIFFAIFAGVSLNFAMSYRSCFATRPATRLSGNTRSTTSKRAKRADSAVAVEALTCDEVLESARRALHRHGLGAVASLTGPLQ